MQIQQNSIHPLSINKTIVFVAADYLCGNGYDTDTMDHASSDFRDQHMSILIQALRAINIKAMAVCWQNQQFNWKNQNLIFVLAHVWDYGNNFQKFMNWLDFLTINKIKMINDPLFVKWNSKKTYLLQLVNHGFLIPQTMIFNTDHKVNFREALKQFHQKFGTNDIIIKGVVDASGVGFKKVNHDKLQQAQKHFQYLKANNYGVVMQKLVPELYKKGEFSFVIFNTKTSHIYIKVPCKEQLRVQLSYGGRSFHIKKDLSNAEDRIKQIKQTFRDDFDLTGSQIKLASLQIQQIKQKIKRMCIKIGIEYPSYLRIDFVLVKQQIVIMQLQGIEPDLEFRPALNNDNNNDIINNYIKQVILLHCK